MDQITVYPYEDVWRFKPSNFGGEAFSHDYPTEAAAQKAARAWAARQSHI